jgi:hypothetical protein
MLSELRLLNHPSVRQNHKEQVPAYAKVYVGTCSLFPYFGL